MGKIDDAQDSEDDLQAGRNQKKDPGVEESV